MTSLVRAGVTTVPRSRVITGDRLESVLVVANRCFAERLMRVGAGDWGRPTPCAEWDGWALVNHVVGANVRYRLLLHGASLEEVEATRQANHVGDDPLTAFVTTAAAVVDSFRQHGVLDRTFRHVTGDRTGRELLMMRILDVGVHSWDLARAIDGDETIDADVVAVALTATTPGDGEGADTPAQDRLLLRLGRQPMKEPTP
jgi:uncharacterized protein (TIGR03086 family)